jgi:integrase
MEPEQARKPQPHHNRTASPGVKLTRHVKGWVAKIGGKVRWLAPLDKRQLALERYHEKMAAHLAGVTAPPAAADKLAPLGRVSDLFLNAKAAKVDAGELRPRTLNDYRLGLQRMLDHFGGATPALSVAAVQWQVYRAELTKTLDPHSLARYVGAVRTLSKWAVENDYVDRPFRFGTEFRLPSQKALRQSKRDAGARVFTATEVGKLVRAADPVLRAVLLLSLNGGIGNTDLATLRVIDVKLDAGVIEFERSKTGVHRLIPLWPKTVKALREAMPRRPAPAAPQYADRVFLTPKGLPLVRDKVNAEGVLTSTTDAIGTAFVKLARAAEVKRTFYDARRTFQTIGDERGPGHVVRAIMGHADRGEDMSSRYRQAIPRAELEAVVAHVGQRLNISKIAWTAPVGAASAAPRTPARSSGTRGKRRRRQAESAT